MQMNNKRTVNASVVDLLKPHNHNDLEFLLQHAIKNPTGNAEGDKN